MRKIVLQHQTALLLICFVVSRMLVAVAGVRFQSGPLFTYWQYLDVQSLQHDLLHHLWYFHAQPPVFNLFAGILFQLGGPYYPLVFKMAWFLITLCNTRLLLVITRRLLPGTPWPLLIAGWYLLSPATILYENELFYTSFTSLLLLVALYFLQQWCSTRGIAALTGFFAAAVLLCLSRTVFHLLWLAGVSGWLLVRYAGKPAFPALIRGSIASILAVAIWYGKNAVLFGTFSASSWMGLNLARIVYHDIPAGQLSGIAAVHPFYPVSYYRSYIGGTAMGHYAGMDDRVLLREMKSDTAINMNHVDYLAVSTRYKAAALAYARRHPGVYAKHVLAAFIIFFTPASSYYQVQENNSKIAGYDLLYSLNLSHLVKGEGRQKVMLAVSAIPKFLLYAAVFLLLLQQGRRRKHFSTLSLFIMGTIGFVLVTSSLLEYGENMRFRYELEPAFLILPAVLLAGRRKGPGLPE